MIRSFFWRWLDRILWIIGIFTLLAVWMVGAARAEPTGVRRAPGNSGTCIPGTDRNDVANSYRASGLGDGGVIIDATAPCVVRFGPSTAACLGSEVDGDIVLGRTVGDGTYTGIVRTGSVFSNFFSCTNCVQDYVNNSFARNSFPAFPFAIDDPDGFRLAGCSPTLNTCTTTASGIGGTGQGTVTRLCTDQHLYYCDGTSWTRLLSATLVPVTITVPALLVSSCDVQDLTVTGALTTDVVSVTPRYDSATGSLGIVYASCLTNGTVRVKHCNGSTLSLTTAVTAGTLLIKLER